MLPQTTDAPKEQLAPIDKPLPSVSRKDQILLLKQDGFSQAAIGLKVGCSQAYVSEVVRAALLKPIVFLPNTNSNIDESKLLEYESKGNNAPLLGLVPLALQIWQQALQGRTVKPESIRVSEKILKSAGVLDESAQDDRIEYDGLTTKELWERMTRAATVLKLAP